MNKVRSNSSAIWTYLAAAVICLCCYVGVFQTHHYYTFDLMNWLYITIALCIVIIQATSFEHHDRWMSKLRAFIMILVIGGPIIYCIRVLREEYHKQQLQNYGITVSAKVVKLYTVKHGRRNSYYNRSYAEFEYQVEGKTWKQKLENKDYNLNVNDQIEIKCSSQEPEIFEVVGLKVNE